MDTRQALAHIRRVAAQGLQAGLGADYRRLPDAGLV